MRRSTLPLIIASFAAGAACATLIGRPLAEVKGGRAPAVLTHHEAEERVAPSGKGSVRVLARGERAFLGLLRMDGGGEVPQHRDASEEFVYILAGGGTITIDGAAETIGVGSAVYMPAGATVSFTNGPRELVALQVFADPTSAAKYDGWATREPAD